MSQTAVSAAIIKNSAKEIFLAIKKRRANTIANPLKLFARMLRLFRHMLHSSIN
jgi:hypothetical protein